MPLSRIDRNNRGNSRVAMVIDNLEPGGAQRQFCLLATRLRSASFHVEIFTLRGDSFFRHLLRGDPPIHVAHHDARNRVQLLFLLRKWLRRLDPAVVVSFLSWPNVLVELAGIPRRNFATIVSERNTDMTPPGFRRRFRYLLHRGADLIVSNSHSQAHLIIGADRGLESRTTVIPNAVDTEYFRPSVSSTKSHSRGIHMLVLARFVPQKNPLRLIAAIGILKSRRPELSVHVNWYGKRPESPRASAPKWHRRRHERARAYYRSVETAIAEHGLEGRVLLHGPTEDVRPLYHRADVLCLPSLYEGYPNVVAEAMACGVPVLASAVGDTARMVDHGRCGFLFDPRSVDDIAATIVRFCKLSDRERLDFGAAGRTIAESLLSVDAYAKRYIRLIHELTCRGALDE